MSCSSVAESSAASDSFASDEDDAFECVSIGGTTQPRAATPSVAPSAASASRSRTPSPFANALESQQNSAAPSRAASPGRTDADATATLTRAPTHAPLVRPDFGAEARAPLVRALTPSWTPPELPGLGALANAQPAVWRDERRRRDLGTGIASGVALALAAGVGAWTTRGQWLPPLQQFALPYLLCGAEYAGRLSDGIAGFRHAWHHGMPVVDALGRPLPCRAVVRMDLPPPAWPY